MPFATPVVKNWLEREIALDPQTPSFPFGHLILTLAPLECLYHRLLGR